MARLDLSTLAEATPVEEKLPPRPAGRLTLIPPSRVAANRVNPRTNFGSPDDLLDLGHSLGRKQLQAIRCVTKGAYERLFPEHSDELGSCDVVVVNGERRYRAALAAGLSGIEAIIDDDLAESRQVFIDAVITENIDRQDFDPIEEAHGIELLVAEFGSADAVAAHYNRHKSWVSQRRSLLKLAPEVQQLVREGTIPIRRARELASLPPTDQLTTWEERTAGEQARRTAPTPAPEERRPEGNKPKERTPTPDSKTQAKSQPRAQALPWESPAELADLLIANMSSFNLAALARHLQIEIEKQ
jgi:ParB family chromosome partitioning protein